MICDMIFIFSCAYFTYGKFNALCKSKPLKKTLTINNNSSWGAPSPSHDVAGYTCVISRVGQSRFINDQVVICSWVKMNIDKCADRFIVLHPFNLKIKRNTIMSKN